jgi:hypothetical protein
VARLLTITPIGHGAKAKTRRGIRPGAVPEFQFPECTDLRSRVKHQPLKHIEKWRHQRMRFTPSNFGVQRHRRGQTGPSTAYYVSHALKVGRFFCGLVPIWNNNPVR